MMKACRCRRLAAPGATGRPKALQLRVPCRRAAAASSASEGSATEYPVVDWEARMRQRMVGDIVDSGKKLNKVHDAGNILAGMAQLQALLPGPPTFAPNMEAMKASDWAVVLLDTQPVANRLVTLKVHFPGMNLSKVIAKRPSLLLRTVEDLEKDAIAVKKLLARAKNMDLLLEAVPNLLSPKALLSVIVTVNKWYKLERDPVEVLENDPDLIRRAQDMDVPFEPVYEDENGNYQAPQYNYMEKRTDWQAYIDRTRYGRP